jgi:hypothetical protein
MAHFNIILPSTSRSSKLLLCVFRHQRPKHPPHASLHFSIYVIVILPEDGRYKLPKHVAQCSECCVLSGNINRCRLTNRFLLTSTTRLCAPPKGKMVASPMLRMGTLRRWSANGTDGQSFSSVQTLIDNIVKVMVVQHFVTTYSITREDADYHLVWDFVCLAICIHKHKY